MKHARLFTFQRACILNLFDETGKYTPTWKGINASAKDRIAYTYAGSFLKRLGLSDGNCPPVWTYETQPENLEHLATMLLSDHELSQSDFVTLELSVPSNMILRSSYHQWCSVYFDCLETGEIGDDGGWLDWSSASTDDADDVIQAILPFLKRTWIVSCAPLHQNPQV
ncbi:hypothetical protein ABLO27_06820 [Roseibium sp. SCPC15]|uniref:hypothetical protein n=1 Tax=Roseibium sp. SCP15 TaxID=3141376 RepID=UPI00333AD3B0